MSLGVLALLVSFGAALWLLYRLAKGEGKGGENRNMTIFKGVVWLGLVAALFAAKLWPLAFMVLIAAGGVMGIELWRDRAIREDESAHPPVNNPARAAMTEREAAEVLGLEEGASADEVRAAHKKLIGQIHPDKGGTDYLASKINEARDLLLRRLEAEDCGD